MASVKMCDLDGQMFIERAPGSVRIDNGTVYDADGKARPFAGELCPECGSKITTVHRNFRQLPAPTDYHDSEELDK